MKTFFSKYLLVCLSLTLVSLNAASNQQNNLSEHDVTVSSIPDIDLPENKNQWNFLQPYQATYQVNADGDDLGSATRKISHSNGNWKLSLTGKISKWLLTMRTEEYSEFNIQQNQLFAQKFFTQKKVTFGKTKEVSQSFNWQEKKETGNKDKTRWELPLEEHLFDRMSHLLALRKDVLNAKNSFDYLISYKGNRKIYQYKNAGTEIVRTPLGELTAIKMTRTNGDDARFSIWFCPELEYIPIKIAQFEQDKPDVIMTISKFEPLAEVKTAAK